VRGAVTPKRRSPALTLIAVAVAVLWGLLLPVLALTLPIESAGDPTVTATATALPATTAPIATAAPTPSGTESLVAIPRYSLVHENGYPVLAWASIPLVVAIGVGVLLYAARRTNRRGIAVPAWILSIVITLAAIVGFVTYLIGIFVVPTGALLVAACAAEHQRRRPAPVIAAPGAPA
jgi:hypothetical protein